MNATRAAAPGRHDQVPVLRQLSATATAMSEGHTAEDVLGTAASVPSWGSCQVEACYLLRDDTLTACPFGGRLPERDVVEQVDALAGGEGAVALPGGRWGWAFALRGLGRQFGYLVVGAPTEPSDADFLLVKLLAQQTAAALANVSLRRAERDHERQLRVSEKKRARADAQLAAAVSDLERQTTIHNVLTGVSASGGGERGIAGALHELTGLAVAVEDRFGNLRAWAGPGRPEPPYPKPAARRRDEVLHRAARCGRPVRDGDRLIALAQPRHEVLGVLALIDPGRRAGRQEEFALEHGATVLALELAHQRNLAEVELRLRRELVDDLITGTDRESAYARSEAVGHDLHGPHRVAVVRRRERAADEDFAEAIARAAGATGMRCLLARRAGLVVLLVSGTPSGRLFYDAVTRELGGPSAAIGISGPCHSPTDLPRSFREALRALDIRQKSISPTGVTSFEELGIYRILGTGDGETELFVREWLGALLDYDAAHHADLVRTLAQYLDCGGNYDHTADALVIHRSTLRYRLRRIREITGLDLRDADSRLNLHVATRAWKVLAGSPELPAQRRPAPGERIRPKPGRPRDA